MIRPMMPTEGGTAVNIINDAAAAYEGIVSADAMPAPYMTKANLVMDIAMGVKFWCVDNSGTIAGVMGIQKVDGISLIRHAYVLTEAQRQGVGSGLLKRLMDSVQDPVLVGTWRAPAWSTRFYEKHGFTKIDGDEKDQLLRKYWKLFDRHIEESVVFADKKWFER